MPRSGRAPGSPRTAGAGHDDTGERPRDQRLDDRPAERAEVELGARWYNAGTGVAADERVRRGERDAEPSRQQDGQRHGHGVLGHESRIDKSVGNDTLRREHLHEPLGETSAHRYESTPARK